MTVTSTFLSSISMNLRRCCGMTYGADHQWLKIKLVGAKSNRSAIGARVIVHYGGKKQAQAIISQSSFYSSNDPRLHFGLGAAATADVEIFWPSGTPQNFRAVPANQLAVINEEAGIVSGAGWSKK